MPEQRLGGSYAIGLADELVAYPELVNELFEGWLEQQRNAGRALTDEQVTHLFRVS